MYVVARGVSDVALVRLRRNVAAEQARDGVGHTPLFWASRGGHSGMVELLLSRGAHVNAQDKKEVRRSECSSRRLARAPPGLSFLAPSARR